MEICLWLGICSFFGVRVFLFFKNRKILKIKDLNNIHHRLFFLAVDIGGLCFLSLQLYKYRFSSPDVLSWVGIMFFLAGLFFSTWSRFYLGNNWDTAGTGGLKKDHQLITTGPFKISRNPIYLGTLFLFLGFEIIIKSFFVFLVIPLFLLIIWEAKREEKMIASHFGEAFQEYKKAVPFLFPWLPKFTA